MAKAKLYYKEIPMTPTLFTVEVIVSKDHEEACKKLSSLTELTQEEAEEAVDYFECMLFVGDKTGKHMFIMLHGFKPDIIAHEALHATWRLCDLVDIKLTENNHEIQAYYVEYLVKEIMAMKKDKPCLK